MILLASTHTLEVVLTAAKTTNDMPVVGAFVNHNSSFSVTALTPIVTATNGTTAVTAVAAAASGEVRQVKTLTIFNQDTAGKVVKVQMNAVTGGAKSVIIQASLDVGDCLQFSDTDGWFVLNSIGQVKTGASIALADDAVVTSKLADNNVTNAKLAQMAAATVKGNSSGSLANAADLSMDTLFSILKGKIPVAYAFAISDETNAIATTGDKVKGIRIPFNMSCTAITGSLSVAQSAGNALTLNVKRDATSLFSTQLVFTNGVRTCTSGVLTSTPLALYAQDEIIGAVSQVGTAAALGAKITIHGFMA
jgi:hypothetical protein